DVLWFVSEDIVNQELSIVRRYNYNLLEIIDELLELRAHFLREYYVLHISENIEWVKEEGIKDVLESMHVKDFEVVKELFRVAVASGEIALPDHEKAALTFLEIIRGIGLVMCIEDVITGMPIPNKVDDIL